MADKVQGIFSVVFMLVLFIAVLALAYYATKLVGRRFSGTGLGMGSRYIRVLDRLALSQDKQLLIVRVGERTMLLGASSQSVELVCELEGMEFPQEEPPPAGPPFSQIFGNLVRKDKGKQDE